MTLLDPTSIYKRGLNDPDALDPFERLVYLVQEIETCSDMEGWDHFFIHRGREDCEALRKILCEIGDSTSAEIIDDYAAHLHQIGVAFPPSDLPCESCDSDRDWGKDFAAATDERWRKVDAFLRGHGLELAR